MFFELVGEIDQIETFSAGSGIRELPRLQKQYGKGRWRKRKGIAIIRMADHDYFLAEIHWYKASGFGRKEYKVKQLLRSVTEVT